MPSNPVFYVHTIDRLTGRVQVAATPGGRPDQTWLPVSIFDFPYGAHPGASCTIKPIAAGYTYTPAYPWYQIDPSPGVGVTPHHTTGPDTQKSVAPRCECGVDKAGVGGLHSSWCPKAEP